MGPEMHGILADLSSNTDRAIMHFYRSVTAKHAGGKDLLEREGNRGDSFGKRHRQNQNECSLRS